MRLWRGTAILAGSNVVGTVLGVSFGIVIARGLGPASKGVLAVLVTILQVAAVAGNLGFYRSNLYYAGHQPEARSRLAANALVIAAVLGTLTALAFYVGITRWGHALLGDAPPEDLALVLGATPFYFYNQYAQGILLGMGQLVRSQSVDVVARTGLLVGSLVLVVGLHRDVQSVLAFFAATQMAQSLAYAVVIRLHVGPAATLFDKDLFNSQVRYAGRTYAAALLAFLLSRMDLFFIHWYSGDAPAGLYSVATQAVDVLSYLPLAMSAQLIPHLAGQSEQDATLTCQATRVLALVMLGLCVLVAAAAWPGIFLLYGHRFVGCVPSVFAILPGALFLSVQTLLAADLAGRGYPPFLIWVWLPGLVVEAVGLPLTVPALGLPGAAGVTAAAYLTVCVLTVHYFLRFHHLRLGALVPSMVDIRSLRERLRR